MQPLCSQLLVGWQALPVRALLHGQPTVKRGRERHTEKEGGGAFATATQRLAAGVQLPCCQLLAGWQAVQVLSLQVLLHIEGMEKNQRQGYLPEQPQRLSALVQLLRPELLAGWQAVHALPVWVLLQNWSTMRPVLILRCPSV